MTRDTSHHRMGLTAVFRIPALRRQALQVGMAVCMLATVATNVAGQSLTGQLTVSVTVVRSCAVKVDRVSVTDERAWVRCDGATQPARVETRTPFASGVPTSLPLMPSADCPNCRVLVLNF